MREALSKHEESKAQSWLILALQCLTHNFMFNAILKRREKFIKLIQNYPHSWSRHLDEP